MKKLLVSLVLSGLSAVAFAQTPVTTAAPGKTPAPEATKTTPAAVTTNTEKTISSTKSHKAHAHKAKVHKDKTHPADHEKKVMESAPAAK